MKTTNSFSILFFLKKDKASKEIAPLYVRITINKKFVDISLKRRLKLISWDQYNWIDLDDEHFKADEQKEYGI